MGNTFTVNTFTFDGTFLTEERKHACENYFRNHPVSTTTANTLAVFPGFCDVHVHLREPGFSYKETIKTGTEAAKAGGFSDVCSMPNLNPVPDSYEHLKEQLDIIKRDASVRVHPYGAITVGELGEKLSAMDELTPFIAAFSDDGRGVQSDDMMESAMRKAKRLGKIIAAHCEDNTLLRGGYIHDGAYAASHGHRGICSESEWRQIERDLKLVAKTGVSYHVCHVSTAESVALIREAKKAGLDVTCETAPHYLVLTDKNLEENARFKMNPPLRAERDKHALIEGLLDGTVDMIATDHAPHSAEEKGRGLEKSLMGVVGLETAFPVMYTHFVKTGILSMETLIDRMSTAPKKRFGIADNEKDFTVWDLDACQTVCPEEFKTMGRATPFEGASLYGKCVATHVEM